MKLTPRSSKTLRERTVSTTLSCGLPAILLPKPGLNKKIAIVATRYGSVDLEFRIDGRDVKTPPGIAHFLEHQLFKKESGTDLIIEFGRFGASSNAFTEYCTTAYYFTCSERFFENLRLLLRLAFVPYWHPDYVAKEKLIIEQELRMYEDSPDYQVYRNLMAGLYQVHPVRIDVGGTVEDIRRIDAALLEDCYKVFYNPANMVLILAGDLDPRETFAIAEGAIPPTPRGGEIRRFWPKEPPGAKKAMTWTESVVSRPKLLLGFKDLDLDGRDILARDLQMSVLLDLVFGRASRFYNRHYETGLIDDGFSASYNSDLPYGFSLIGGETDEPERLAEEVLKEIARARKERLKKRDVERAKRKRLGRYLRAFDTPDGAAFLLLGSMQKNVDLFEVPKAISRLRPGEIEERLRHHFDDRNYAISVVAPKKPGAG
ncbi:MAG: insulinase family protein [Planctomycetes bacterium]|nr:insulinase family protein [Planctomycetota bacterium]